LALAGFLASLITVGQSTAQHSDAGPKSPSRDAFAVRISAKSGNPGRSAVLRFNVQSVQIPISVVDELYRPVTSLAGQSFRIFEDGVEQQIASFIREDAPVSLGLLFDTSSSMKTRMDASVAALKQFIATAMPEDEFFLVQFSDQPSLVASFTQEPELLYGKMGFLQPKGWTALLDAIALGVSQMRSASHPRKALLILSDGADNNSRFSESEIKTMVLEADIRIYAIALFQTPRLLQHLADITGGFVLVAQNLNDLPGIVDKLSAQIRSQYLVGYSSTNPRNDGKYRRVKVELAQPADARPLRVSWRRGYYAPIE
jgi:VWFA-related protein